MYYGGHNWRTSKVHEVSTKLKMYLLHYCMITVRVCGCAWWWVSVVWVGPAATKVVELKTDALHWGYCVGACASWARLLGWGGCSAGGQLLLCGIGECCDHMQRAWNAQARNIQFTLTHPIPHPLRSAEHMTWNCRQWHCTLLLYMNGTENVKDTCKQRGGGGWVWVCGYECGKVWWLLCIVY